MINQDELKAWAKRRANQDVVIETVDNDSDQLATLLNDNLPHLVALPIGQNQNLALWRDFVGETNTNIYYDFDEATAYVYFNVTSVATADLLDASESISKLLETTDFTQKSLAEELGVNEMTISRNKSRRRSEHYDARLDLNLRIHRLLQRAHRRF